MPTDSYCHPRGVSSEILPHHLPHHGIRQSKTACHSNTLSEVATVVPELVCDEDDPPFQKQGGKNTEQVADAERREEGLEVHMFEPGVQRAAQFNHLPGNRSSREGPAYSARPLTHQVVLCKGGPLAG